jgi:Toxin SymE, type I toxin-antitoxin system
MRSRLLAALQSLPALARNRSSRAARRFVRRHAASDVLVFPKKKRNARRKDVRVLTMASLYRPSRSSATGWVIVPYLRMSGRWLEQCGFRTGERVYVKAEQGRLTLTNEDPAPSEPSRG